MRQVCQVGFYIKSSKTILIIYNLAMTEQGFFFFNLSFVLSLAMLSIAESLDNWSADMIHMFFLYS